MSLTDKFKDTIPVVIVHIGNQTYFQNCVKNNAKFNDVILIGDNTNIRTFLGNPRITHYHIENLSSNAEKNFRQMFKNYSTNAFDAEYICFKRYYLYMSLMDELGIDKIAVCDSDCIFLAPVNQLWDTLFPSDADACMEINDVPIEGLMYQDTVANNAGFITRQFCKKFIDLCNDIYISQSKFNLIEGKIQWHSTNQIPGGISDRTICTIMQQNGIANIANMLGTQLFDSELCVFDWNLQSPNGHNGSDTFLMLKSGIKYAKKEADDKYYAISMDGHKIRLLTMHFQGYMSKKVLETFIV